MADTRDRTEPASQRRLQRAYDEGQVPVGREASMVAALAAGAVALVTIGPALRDGLANLVAHTARSLADGRPSELGVMLARPLLMCVVVCASAGLAAVVVTAVQTKAGMWANLALPDPKRVFGGGRLSRLFKREFLVDLGLALVKVTAVGTVVWLSLRADFLTLPRLMSARPDAQLTALFAPLGSAAVKVLTVMAVFGGLDLAVTRLRFLARMRMTKEEAKREYKEDEGDPLLRSRRRRRHRELARGRVAAEVPRADALVVNPTHVAVAIRYRKSTDRAPRVTAKGKGQLAEIMRDLARNSGVPIVEDVALARLLHRRVKIGREVPVETYRAVAAVLAFVYRVTGRQPGAGVVS
jgi:flagellar biosynthesis protein FlhB